MATYQGIDVSTFQGNIDWTRVKNASVDFAILRASYGWENRDRQVDARFHENAQGLRKRASPLARIILMPPPWRRRTGEADFFLDVIKGYRLGYPVAYDIETASQQALGTEGYRRSKGLVR